MFSYQYLLFISTAPEMFRNTRHNCEHFKMCKKYNHITLAIFDRKNDDEI